MTTITYLISVSLAAVCPAVDVLPLKPRGSAEAQPARSSSVSLPWPALRISTDRKSRAEPAAERERAREREAKVWYMAIV